MTERENTVERQMVLERETLNDLFIQTDRHVLYRRSTQARDKFTEETVRTNVEVHENRGRLRMMSERDVQRKRQDSSIPMLTPLKIEVVFCTTLAYLYGVCTYYDTHHDCQVMSKPAFINQS